MLLKMLKLLRRTFCETQSEISYRHGYIGLHTDPLTCFHFLFESLLNDVFDERPPVYHIMCADD